MWWSDRWYLEIQWDRDKVYMEEFAAPCTTRLQKEHNGRRGSRITNEEPFESPPVWHRAAMLGTVDLLRRSLFGNTQSCVTVAAVVMCSSDCPFPPCLKYVCR